jgi:hypothetical protein
MFLHMSNFPKDEVEHRKKYGNSSALPPNFEEITLEQFSHSKFFVYVPDFWEYRQIWKDEDVQRFAWGKDNRHYAFSIRLAYMYDGTGFGLVSDYSANTVRYFKFAYCIHTMKEKTIGNCLHELTCTQCGFKEQIDSSG